MDATPPKLHALATLGTGQAAMSKSNPGQRSDETSPTLLTRARDLTDQDAWSAIDQLYGGWIYRRAVATGLAGHQADDIRQTVLCRLMRVLPRFDYQRQIGRFRSYLLVLVRNEINRTRRVHGHGTAHAPTDLDSLPGSEGADATAPGEIRWMQRHLDQALVAIASHMRPSSIRVFERLLAGESTREIATSTGMSVCALQKIRQRVMARLRLQVRRQVLREEGRPAEPPED